MIGMKKRYVKPGIIIEDFKIAQSISAGCAAAHDSSLGGPTQWGKTTCGWDAGGAVVWTQENTHCTIKAKEDATDYVFCYNAPEGANIFGSY